MKIEEIPQDEDPSYSGQKKLCYAVDSDGRIVQGHSSGWKTEETVKLVAWDVIHKDLEHTRKLIREGRVSALSYFMKLRQMDARLLAQNMQTPVLRIYLHLRPYFYRRLSPAWLARYADCLEVPVRELVEYRGEPHE